MAAAAFLSLTWIVIDMIVEGIREAPPTTNWPHWYSNPIEKILMLIGIITLANGISYLSEAFSKNRDGGKLSAGILSLAAFIPLLLSKEQRLSDIAGITSFVGISLGSILIAAYSAVEWARFKMKWKWLFAILFAFNSGICALTISALLYRGHNLEQGGYLLLVFGVVLIPICLIINSIAVFSLKKANKKTPLI